MKDVSGYKICDVYTDGSFRDGIVGSGVVIKCSEVIEEFAFSIKSEALSVHRNVSGEIYAVMYAVLYASKKGINKIRIFHDYSGLANWISGEWKTKTELTKLYKAFLEHYMNYVDIEFTQVQAHKGNQLNNLADKLAKKALEGKFHAPYFEDFLAQLEMFK
jgi:ribonuclease HI